MKICFEPQSPPVVAHERLVRAVVDEIKPADFCGVLLVEQYWRDRPVQISLRAEGNRTVTSSMPLAEYYGADGERHLRDALTRLFAAALEEWKEKKSKPTDSGE